MTDKEKIKAEVQKWINNRTDCTHVAEADIVATKRCAYQDVLNFINSLPEEPVSEDLEEEVVKYAAENGFRPESNILRNIFKAGAQWQKNHIWHDTNETPVYIEGDKYANSILVFGKTSLGLGSSVGNMVDENTIYTPINEKEYKWGECPFTKWAYVRDLTPKED